MQPRQRRALKVDEMAMYRSVGFGAGGAIFCAKLGAARLAGLKRGNERYARSRAGYPSVTVVDVRPDPANSRNSLNDRFEGRAEAD